MLKGGGYVVPGTWAEGWSDISTAPKDRDILLSWPGYGVAIGRWKFNDRIHRGYFSDSWEWDDYEMADLAPTHWMDIPRPPTNPPEAPPPVSGTDH